MSNTGSISQKNDDSTQNTNQYDSSLGDQDTLTNKSLGTNGSLNSAKQQSRRSVSFDDLPLDGGSGIFTTSSGSGAFSVHSGSVSKLSNDKSVLSLSSLRSDGRKGELSILRKKRQRSVESQQAMEELTINKLDFKSMGLIGRKQEIETLKLCYARLLLQEDNDDTETDTKPESKNELVFIRGFSGAGKSKLARTMSSFIEATPNGVYVEGKYEFTAMDQPYSGIAQAFGKLCAKIHDSPEDAIAKMSKAVTELLMEEAKMLVRLIPELNVLMDDQATEKTSVDNMETERGQERWKYAFRTLTRILGSYFHPLVLMWDDLQWADVSSLDVLEYLISDVHNTHPLMIIGCYRSDEVTENTILFHRIQTLQSKCDQFSFRITDIEVNSCDVNAVNEMIMSMMSLDDESKTRELAEVCFKRTHGNPFFVIEFMAMLQAEGLVAYNLGLLKWGFDVAKIEDATMSTANVVSLLQARMRKLPDNAQLLLQYAACLGASFFLATLKFLWEDHASIAMIDSAQSNFSQMLRVVQDAKLIETCGSDELRFVHDKVQEAALYLSDLVNPSFQFGLGLCLYRGLDPTDLEEQLFDVVDLINQGNATNKVELARLNLRAAKKARRISAFQSAANYCLNGIKLLPSDPWTEEHRELTLDLYTLGSEMELAVGHVDKVEEYVTAVLAQKECTRMEVVPVKMISAKLRATTQMRFNDAIDICLELLKEMDYKLVWSQHLVGIQAIKLAMQTIKSFKKLPLEHFDSLQKMKDPKQQAIVTLVSRVQYSAFHAKRMLLNILCTCRLVELTLAHGISEFSGASIASLATLVLFLQNDQETMVEFSEIAFSLQAKYGGSRFADTTYILYGHALSWVRPLHACLTPTLDGYTQGLRSGDNECSMWNLIAHFVFFPYAMGSPLAPILGDCPKVLLQLEEAKLKDHLLVLRVMFQMIVNLQLPPGEEPEKLNGIHYFFREGEDGTESASHMGTLHLAQGELMVFHGNYKELANRAISKGDYYSACLTGIFLIPMETFHRGIALYAMARRTKSRKFKSRAKKIRKQVKKWSNDGNPNVKHYDMILNAEQAVLDKQYNRADELYKEAIVYTARTGHLHHAALSNERYADYRLLRSDVDDAKYHMTEAIRYYREWGAVGKAEKLKKEMDEL